MSTLSLTLRDVLDATGGRLQGQARLDLPLNGVQHDSRTIRPGALFVALRGPKHDGHHFIADAFARGAAAALVESIPGSAIFTVGEEGPPLVLVPRTDVALRELAAFWYRRVQSAVIVVSGSIGRSSTADLIAAVLRQQLVVQQASAVHRPELTVPLALLTIRPGTARLVLEMGPFAVAEVEQLLELLHPSSVVVTNIQRWHGEPDRPLDKLAEPRAALLAALTERDVAVLNADDALVRGLAARTRAPVILYGLDPGSPVRAENVLGRGVQGVVFDLVVGERRVYVRLPLLGLNCVHSALAAAAVGVAEGLELRAVGAGLQTSSPTPRIILATGLNGSRVLDDTYSAQPESALEALNLLATLDGRKIAVLGDMPGLGRLEAAGHQKVGNRAALVVDALVTVGERSRIIADEARRVSEGKLVVLETTSIAEAIACLQRLLRPGDNVLIKGSRGLGFDDIVQAVRLEG